ncbi:hypothetical protein AC579_5972 [Pseudocercospora musae]|uniref:Uncharacterized protein n=1 Tax=Pseudocercospora musae TaxID=113226 RepID=A0A139I1M6_9PEZI|nr:hypothetical protein AC579_5972 [Pseudocercospora musae]
MVMRPYFTCRSGFSPGTESGSSRFAIVELAATVAARSAEVKSNIGAQAQGGNSWPSDHELGTHLDSTCPLYYLDEFFFSIFKSLFTNLHTGRIEKEVQGEGTSGLFHFDSPLLQAAIQNSKK